MSKLGEICGFSNTNQAGARAGQSHAGSRRESVARQPRDVASVGTRNTQPSRLGKGGADGHSGRHLGGQASAPGLFGCPSATGRPRVHSETSAPAQAAAQGQTPPQVRLSFPARRALLRVVLASLPVRSARAAEVICPVPSTLEALRAKYAHLVDRPMFEDGDEPTAIPPMGAMKLAALASDAREAFPHFHDDEEGDRMHRTSGAGYVNVTLAHEG